MKELPLCHILLLIAPRQRYRAFSAMIRVTPCLYCLSAIIIIIIMLTSYRYAHMPRDILYYERDARPCLWLPSER